MSDVPMRCCRKCNVEFPATSQYFQPIKDTKTGLHAWCRSCMNARRREYRKNAHVREREREYRKTGKSAAYQQAYMKEYLLRPEVQSRVTELQKERNRRRDPVKIQAYNREYRTTKNGKQSRRLAHQRRRARKQLLPDTLTQSSWQRCLEYFGHACVVCGRTNCELVPDHWIPLSRGGGTTPNNIVPMCNGVGGCNQSKHNHVAAEWLKGKVGTTRAAEIVERVEKYFKWVSEALDTPS